MGVAKVLNKVPLSCCTALALAAGFRKCLSKSCLQPSPEMSDSVQGRRVREKGKCSWHAVGCLKLWVLLLGAEKPKSS